jgi:5-methyltetrahydrofolate--homocysteine methyltransferase
VVIGVIIIGERINSSRKQIYEAMRSRNAELLQKEALIQYEAGANYIDCNAAALGVDEEPQALSWAVSVVQDVVEVPICIDSPNPEAIANALKVHRGRALINSITAEALKMQKLVPLAVEWKARVVALCMDDNGIPKGVEERLRIAERLVETLTTAGISEDDIFIDPLVLPIGVDNQVGLIVLESIAQLRERFEGVHIVIGLTNISHGMPQRRWLNRSFLVMAMAHGLDSVICDPTDKALMALMIASETLLGLDEFCMRYINAARSGMLEP